MKKRIVLGQPFLGSFLWFNTAHHFGESTKVDWRATSDVWIASLYGPEPKKFINQTLSLMLLFDEVYITPTGDNIILDGQREYHRSKNTLENLKKKYDFDYRLEPFGSNMGIKVNENWIEESMNIDIDWEKILHDLQINSILETVEPRIEKIGKFVLLNQAINHLYISQKFDALIFASKSYLNLCTRLNELTTINKENLKTKNSQAYSGALNFMFDLFSLKFNIEKIDDYISLRNENSIKKYSKEFIKYIRELPNGDFDDLHLLKSMIEAINSETVGQKIVGGLNLSAKILSISSLFPVIGTASGIAGIALDALSEKKEKELEKYRWWLLPNEIGRKISKQKIESLYKNKIHNI